MIGIEGVILAAGFSSRMKTHKMILKLNGKTLIEHCVDNMYNTCSRIIVVGGYGVDNIRPILAKYKKVELVFNPNYIDGMFGSVKIGLTHVNGERFFLIPGDYPVIHENVYESLLKEDGEVIIPAYKGENGHPVLMTGNLALEIVNCSQWTNLREFINTKGYKKVEVQDRGILMDVDTAEDYGITLQYMAQNSKEKATPQTYYNEAMDVTTHYR